MTLDEFFESFEDAVRKAGDQFILRHRKVRSEQGHLCAICYLCQEKTGKLYPNNYFGDAAEALGLSFGDAEDLVSAADGYVSIFRPNSHVAALRARMLTACRLEEVAAS